MFKLRGGASSVEAEAGMMWIYRGVIGIMEKKMETPTIL